MIEYTIHLEDASSFLCEQCGYVLGKVYDWNGYSALKIFAEDKTHFTILKALVECPVCGGQRGFVSTQKDLIV